MSAHNKPEAASATSRLLAMLEDFRLLPIFVLVSMAIGIAIGSLLSISDFALTPPIEAIKSIAAGTFELSVPAAISLGVPIGLFLMMYPAMTNVRLGEVGAAFRSPRQLAVVLLFNYLVAPFVMLVLANVFVADPELRTGLILYGLAPCIAMVIIFTYLAKGNTPMALVFVALNSVIQMLLIPVYARLLIGDVRFDVAVVGESVILYLGLPLLLGVLTRMLVVRRGGEEAMDRLKPGLNALSIIGLLFTLIVMFALKGDLILQRPGIVLEMAIPMALFFALMFFTVLFIGSRLRFSYRDGVAVAFNATGRDFEIAIAIAITAFSPTVALATVVGPLIEVPVMLFLVWAAMRLSPRWFHTVVLAEIPLSCHRRPSAAGRRAQMKIELPVVPELRLDLSAPDTGEAVRAGALVGDPVRAGILAILRDGPHCVCEMAAALGERQNNVSNHLARLRDAGLVRASRHRVDARWVYYERDEAAIAAAATALRAVLK